MRRTIALALLALSTQLVAQAEPQLFHLSVNDVPVENGKMLNMEFQELTRDADASTVQIIRRSGGSVSSSMFIVRGMCGLTRARGKQNFVSERIGEDNMRYKVTFPDASPEQGKGFTIAQCDILRY